MVCGATYVMCVQGLRPRDGTHCVMSLAAFFFIDVAEFDEDPSASLPRGEERNKAYLRQDER